MPLVNPRGGWWAQQCPARQVGLAHAHDRDCDSPAHEGRCCECGVGPNDRPAQPVPPPINVNQRLQDLGLMERPPVELTEHERRVLEVNVLVPERKRGYR